MAVELWMAAVEVAVRKEKENQIFNFINRTLSSNVLSRTHLHSIMRMKRAESEVINQFAIRTHEKDSFVVVYFRSAFFPFLRRLCRFHLNEDTRENMAEKNSCVTRAELALCNVRSDQMEKLSRNTTAQ